ncbi:MAG TPA: hypothetical protein VGK17_11100 [Propionicimonas sp.]|jgi:hypothetical protein
MSRRSSSLKRRRGRTAHFAREIRLLVAPALGDWGKVLQLSLILVLVMAVATAGCILVVSAAGEAWPLELLRTQAGVLGK